MEEEEEEDWSDMEEEEEEEEDWSDMEEEEEEDNELGAWAVYACDCATCFAGCVCVCVCVGGLGGGGDSVIAPLSSSCLKHKHSVRRGGPAPPAGGDGPRHGGTCMFADRIAG
jgi:hypothetical protein